MDELESNVSLEESPVGIGGEECSCDGDGLSQVKTTHRPEKMKASLTARLNRIEGQVRGIKGMVERDIYCDDVLNQIASAQSALAAVGKLLLENHVKTCIINRVQAGEIEVVDDLLQTIAKLMKR